MFNNKNKILNYMNTYDVTGRKLRAEYHKGGEQDTLRTDYCGNLIYEQGRPKMLLVDGGDDDIKITLVIVSHWKRILNGIGIIF